jgi:ribosome-binding protein aMBF1 (putative translation factor)
VTERVRDHASASLKGASRSEAYRTEQERLAPYEELARLVIKHRAALGLSQEELADRMGTSYSAVSRIESGRHRTSVETLRRLAHALDLRLVVGFESGPPERPTRELVTG